MRTFAIESKPSATVLTHPAFDRAPVENGRWPGPKRGVYSLAKARRQRQHTERRAQASTEVGIFPALADLVQHLLGNGAKANLPARPSPAEIDGCRYWLYAWGELIEGPKELIQAFGIATGALFPGEPGGPARSLTVIDRRGFSVKVTLSIFRGEGKPPHYVASIPYPDRVWANPCPGVFAPGVLWQANVWGDVFVGSAEALILAGLVAPGQFPGQPGMRRVRVSIAPDGAVIGGPPTAKDSRARLPGSKRIEAAGKAGYRVTIGVTEEVENRRRAAANAQESAWRAAMEQRACPEALHGPLERRECRDTFV